MDSATMRTKEAAPRTTKGTTRKYTAKTNIMCTKRTYTAKTKKCTTRTYPARTKSMTGGGRVETAT
eukprot:4059782-Amphidinium_carterae.1